MDPNETLKLWHAARKAGDVEAALEHGTDLATWLNEDGFDPDWTELLKQEFWAWWDGLHETTSYHDAGCATDPCSCGAAPAKARPVAEVLDRVITWMIDHEPRDEEAAFDHAVLLVGLRRAADLTERAGEALAAAKDWLENHGAIYTEDCGGIDEPGLAGVLAMIRAADLGPPTRVVISPPAVPGEPWAMLDEDEARAELVCGCVLSRDEYQRVSWRQCADHAAANPKPETPGEWRCPSCGSSEVEGTAWVVLNTDKATGDEPPSDDCWCPRCETHPWTACVVERESGLCTMHVESAGLACKPKHKEGEQP